MTKNKKIASMILAYNEEKLIRGCLQGLKEVFNIVSISTPWCGEHKSFDKTAEIAKEEGAYVIEKNFRTEGEQRTYISNLAKEMGYEYILIIDADEYYKPEHIEKMLKYIEENPAERYNVITEINFWKDEKWEITPRIRGAREVCVKTGLPFRGYRNIDVPVKLIPEEVVLYHFSYIGPDEKMYSKITHFSHASEINLRWFEDVWKKWTPDSENLHPVGPSYFKKAIPVDCPEDIKNRFYGRS